MNKWGKQDFDADVFAIYTKLQTRTMYGNRSNRNKSYRKREEEKQVWNGCIRNDLGGGNRSKQQYPDSTSYCPSCGYDIKPTHTPVTCTNRKDFHNEAATIDNKMGGVSTNCHFITSSEWWCVCWFDIISTGWTIAC